MKLPDIQEPQRYTGLYVVDFGDHTGVGFKAEEVAALLEEEPLKEIRIYKIHRAQPDGTMDLRGVDPALFHLEAGLFFFADDEDTARREFEELVRLADETAPPAKAKTQLSMLNGRYVVALIYPAEYDPEFSRWLTDADYRTQGEAEGGTGAVTRYYNDAPEILESRQLLPADQQLLAGRELMAATRRALVR